MISVGVEQSACRSPEALQASKCRCQKMRAVDEGIRFRLTNDVMPPPEFGLERIQSGSQEFNRVRIFGRIRCRARATIIGCAAD